MAKQSQTYIKKTVKLKTSSFLSWLKRTHPKGDLISIDYKKNKTSTKKKLQS